MCAERPHRLLSSPGMPDRGGSRVARRVLRSLRSRRGERYREASRWRSLLRRSWRHSCALGPYGRSPSERRPPARTPGQHRHPNGSGRKSASACCNTACRAARSFRLVVTSGPTDNSARVTAVISGSTGRSSGRRRPRRTTVEVSSIPYSLTGWCQRLDQGPGEGPADPIAAAGTTAHSAWLEQGKA